MNFFKSSISLNLTPTNFSDCSIREIRYPKILYRSSEVGVSKNSNLCMIFDRKRKNTIGTVTYTTRTYGGDITINMPIDDLKKELAKIVNMKLTFRVFKKPQT